jgi:hypothetical protein
MRPWLLGAIVSLLILVVLLADNIVVTTQGDTQTPNIEKMVDFLLDTQFNGSLGLCREAPTAAPNTYWLASDNLWAWKALTLAANQPGLANAAEAGATAQKIKNSLTTLAAQYNLPTDSDGLPESFCHEAVIGGPVQLPFRTNNPQTLYSDSYTLKTDMRNGTAMPDWTNYSDLALYGALSYYWQNNDAAAISYYNMAVGMWNETSQGLQDVVNTNFTAGATTGDYSTFKVALLLYVSNLLGQNPSLRAELTNKIYAQQAENGGITTDYYANGASVGDTNTETTSIVIIALLTPPTPTQTPTPPVTPTATSTTPVTPTITPTATSTITISPTPPFFSTNDLMIIAIVSLTTIISLIIIVALKRPFKHLSSST